MSLFGQPINDHMQGTVPLVRIGSIKQFGFHRLSTIRRKSYLLPTNLVDAQ